jgi:putative flippase GtrA
MKLMEFIKNLFKRQFIKYCFSGGIAALVDLGIFFLLNEFLSVHYIYSLTISFTIAAAINYTLQRKITFKSSYSKKHKQFAIFVAIQIIGLVFNGIVTTAQVEFLGAWPTLARFISILIVLLWTYTANKKITFNMK